MSRTIAILAPFLLALSVLLSACEKEDTGLEETETAPAVGGAGIQGPALVPVSFPYADAGLWAVRTYSLEQTPAGPFEVELGSAAASFSYNGFLNLLNVGSVELNGVGLSRGQNNSYSSQPGPDRPMGIGLDPGISWEVEGGDGFPAFNRSIIAVALPVVAEITSVPHVARSEGHTLTIAEVTGADSVVFMIGGVGRTLHGSATSCTFAPAELADLEPGMNKVSVAGYAYTSEYIEERLVVFGMQTVRMQSVTVE